MFHARVFLLLSLLIGPALAIAAGTPLRIGINGNLEEPLLFRQAETPSGIMPAIALALAQALNRSAQLQILPRKRLEPALQEGSIDGICLITPQRLSLLMSNLIWSPPLYTDTDRIISLPDAPLVHRVEDLYGQTVGSVLGYHYPLLDRYFQTGQIHRDDAPSEALNLRKLLEKRFRYMIQKEDAALWHNKLNPQGPRLQFSPLIIERAETRCVFSPHSKLHESQLKSAVQQLNRKGTLQAIRQRYI